jgi:alpha-mannosidase
MQNESPHNHGRIQYKLGTQPAEEDKAYIIRLYEAERSAVKGIWLRFNTIPSRVELVNMLEEKLMEFSVHGTEILLDFQAFEIKTIKVYF